MAAPAMIQNLTDLWTSCPPSGPRLVSGAKPRTPKGSSRTAQGASPGFKVQIAESPERAAQGVRSQLQINARHKVRLWYRDPLHRPSGLPLLLSLFPGLAPWAFLSRPCGASFAPETSLGALERGVGIRCRIYEIMYSCNPVVRR